MTDELRAELERQFPALAKRRKRCTCHERGARCDGPDRLGIGWACAIELDASAFGTSFYPELPRGPISKTAPVHCAAAQGGNGNSAGDATDGHESASLHATFDELLEHLGDLIALAESEGFIYLARELAIERVHLAAHEKQYSARFSTLPSMTQDLLRHST